MATIKSYTDLEQSRKLAEILQPEGADMSWIYNSLENKYTESLCPVKELKAYYDRSIYEWDRFYELTPCWSLAALLGVLPFHLIVDNQRYAFSMIKGLDKNGDTYAIKYAIFNTTIHFHLTDFYSNPVDACYEMTLKLHEQKVL